MKGGRGSTPAHTGNGEVGRGRRGGVSQFRMRGGESVFFSFTSPTVSQMQPQCARSPVQVRCAAAAEAHRRSGGSFRQIRVGGVCAGVSGLHAEPVQWSSFTQAGHW